MELAGFPPIALYIALIIGIPFGLLKPYKAFLVTTFLITAVSSTNLTFTRTQFLGPYFNANDACLLISLTATFSYGVILRNNIWLPNIAKWMILVLLIGFLQSLIVFRESTYEILRAMRWAIGLPLYFIFAATLVNNGKKVRMLLIALFLGSLVSALTHILFVYSRLGAFILLDYDISQIRTFAFFGPGIWLLLASIVWLPKTNIFNRLFIYISGTIFAVSILLSQTRSVWISSIAVLPVTLIVFRQKHIGNKAILISLLGLGIFVGTVQITSCVLPGIKLDEIVIQRFGEFVDKDERFESTLNRQLDFKMETEEWMKGTLIFGRGLSYFSSEAYVIYDLWEVAWGHLGHVTTLAQLGIVGLLVYSILFPIIIIYYSIRLWRFAVDETKFLGLLSGMVMIWCWICFFMSGSFLGQQVTTGIIFGTTYRQARSLITGYKLNIAG